MADRNEKYRQKYLADMSAHIGEQAEAVGIFSRPGAMGRVMLSQISPLAAMVRGKSGKSASGGLPPNVVVGVTADKVFVFAYKPKGTGLKLKEPIGVFARAQTRAEVVSQGAMANRIRFHLPDGSNIELDSNKMPGSSTDFNAPVVQALAS